MQVHMDLKHFKSIYMKVKTEDRHVCTWHCVSR